jgi:hypothetical protein
MSDVMRADTRLVRASHTPRTNEALTWRIRAGTARLEEPSSPSFRTNLPLPESIDPE